MPNVIVFLCDELRRHALSCYGDPNISTPNLDRLAAEGARFTNAVSTYPICIPQRFTLMTGEYAHTRMINGLGWRMSPRERTLADEFNEAGFETLYVGKWHLYGGPIFLPGYSARHEGVKPVPRQFQGRWTHWRAFELRNSPFDTYYFVDDDPTPIKIDGYQTDGLTDIALDFLANEWDRSKPFCSIISVEPPHPPYEAPTDLTEKWLNTEIELPPTVGQPLDNPFRETMGERVHGEEAMDTYIRQRQIYYAMVENIDQNVGKVLDFLEREGLRDSTYLLFTADHGELDGSHGLCGKQYPYEESAGVPLLIAGPGIPASRDVDTPVCTEDLFPTVISLAGLPARDDLPGMDVSPLAKGQANTLDRPGVMLQFVFETRPNMPFHRCIWRSFRTQRYRYDVAGDLTGMRPWQFFDLQADPWEQTNLIDSPDHQDLIARHHRWLYERMRDTIDDAALAPAHGMPSLNVEWQAP